MTELSFALISDGSSDKRLLPILTWLLRQYCPNLAIQPEWVDFRQLQNPPRTLAEKISKCLELYPCDLLFIHRDAENQTYDFRKNEIITTIQNISNTILDIPAICVVPVRMQEAWLLFDESAIRKAVSNPNGSISLTLPQLSTVDSLSDPKTLLYSLMRIASERSGRRLKKMNISKMAHLVAEYINDFSPLRRLPAFQDLEADLSNFIRLNGYNT